MTAFDFLMGLFAFAALLAVLAVIGDLWDARKARLDARNRNQARPWR